MRPCAVVTDKTSIDAIPLGCFLEKGFYRAAHLDQQRIPVSVTTTARSHSDPAFADAILLDIRLLRSVEADADTALEDVLVVMRAFRVNAKTVWQFARHVVSLGR